MELEIDEEESRDIGWGLLNVAVRLLLRRSGGGCFECFGESSDDDTSTACPSPLTESAPLADDGTCGGGFGIQDPVCCDHLELLDSLGRNNRVCCLLNNQPRFCHYQHVGASTLSNIDQYSR